MLRPNHPRLLLLALCASCFSAVSASAQNWVSQWEELMKGGNQAFRAKEYGKAEGQFKKALKVAEAIGPEDVRVGTTLANLATVKKAAGSPREAEPLLKRAIGVFEKTLGPDHPDLMATVQNLGMLYYRQLLASRGFRGGDVRLMQTWSVVSAEGPDITAFGLGGAGQSAAGAIAEAYQSRSAGPSNDPAYKHARECFERVLGIKERKHGPESVEVLESLQDLVDLHMIGGHYPEADPVLQRALAIVESLAGPEHPLAASLLLARGVAASRQKKYADSQPHFQRALQIQEKAYGPEHPNLVATLQNYAEMLRETGKGAEAKAMEERAKAIRKKNKM